MNWTGALAELLGPGLKIVALAGSLAGFALGLALVFRSAPTLRLLGALNRWVSSRRATRSLEIPHAAPRSNRFLGAVFVAVGLYAAAVLALSPFDTRLAAALGYDPRYSLAAFGMSFARWALMAGSALAALVGLLVLFAPRKLAALESLSGYWISSRRLTMGADKMYLPLDRLAERFPRAAGAVIAALSAAAVAASLVLLLAHS
jgi:hypothetical protein